MLDFIGSINVLYIIATVISSAICTIVIDFNAPNTIRGPIIWTIGIMTGAIITALLGGLL